MMDWMMTGSPIEETAQGVRQASDEAIRRVIPTPLPDGHAGPDPASRIFLCLLRRTLNAVRCTVLIAFLAGMVWGLDYHKPLTFEDRVKAQEAIERVYYNHRIWPKENPGLKPPFEQMISQAQIKAKVEDYLKKSVALDQYWQHPLTAEQLQAEMDRMAKSTKDSTALQELFLALGNDPFLIAECIARATLADRLVRSWYANDSRFHGDLRNYVGTLRRELDPSNFAELGGTNYRFIQATTFEHALNERRTDPAFPSMRLDAEDFASLLEQFPPAQSISDVLETPESFIIRFTESRGSDALEGGVIEFKKRSLQEWLNGEPIDPERLSIDPRSVYTLMPRSWQDEPVSPETWKILWYGPAMQTGYSAVWTGTEMIIWGGAYAGYSNAGARYSPATDSWVPTFAGAGCPEGRAGHTAVWTGSEMIIWGGKCDVENNTVYLNTGGRYDPVADAWISTSSDSPCPSARTGHTAVWTGTEMIIWGGMQRSGSDTQYLSSGGRYNPFLDVWTPTSQGSNCPSGRVSHTAVWSGTRMIIWGGFWQTWDWENVYEKTGGIYNPLSNDWVATSTATGCPSQREGHTAVWSGSQMIVWGGFWADTSEHYENTGARFNPTANTWTSTSLGANCPNSRTEHTAIWDGQSMIVWGGMYYVWQNAHYEKTGGRYWPSTDSWTATSTGANCPTERASHKAIWTGTEMLIWGGTGWSGGRYSPSSDSWIPISTQTGGPTTEAVYSTVVWTGAEMIIWGGTLGGNRGWKYDPLLDVWTATSTGGNCPTGRRDHTAVWTGSEMIVWGGYGNSYTTTGGRYNPGSDLWAATSTGAGCPYSRTHHTAVWTGTEMIVWGGEYGNGELKSGARYNPLTDSWVPTYSGAGCPSARLDHTAIWTGAEMIVWGGSNLPDYLNTGGRYDPISDSWAPTSTGANCPWGRLYHSVVWTGTQMIIWGGTNQGLSLFNGARYTPSTDQWSPTAYLGACPTARIQHSAIWTGVDMIVWGGWNMEDDVDFNTGGRYAPAQDTWTATPVDLQTPPARDMHFSVWTGEMMIVWGGFPTTRGGGIYFPNTDPNSIPSATTTHGEDPIFTLGTDEQLDLDGMASTDGSNPLTTIPWHDRLDSVVSFEWDLNGDAHFDNDCSGATSGVEYSSSQVEAIAEDDLLLLGLNAVGRYPLWLRVTDEVGARACGVTYLTVCTGAGPGAPVITETSDDDPCLISGITLAFSGGDGATSHSLLRDGEVVASDVLSPVHYAPGDGAPHRYSIMAAGPACMTYSPAVTFVDDVQTTIPRIIGYSANSCPSQSAVLETAAGMTGYQWYLGGNPIPSAISSSLVVSQTGNYAVSYINAAGCWGISPSRAVTITPCVPSVEYDWNYSPWSSLVQLCGDGDALLEPGEEWRVSVGLTNLGNGNATNTTAMLKVNAGSALSATITGNPADFGFIASGGGTAIASYRFTIDTQAACVNTLTFDLTNIISSEASYPNEMPAFSFTVGSSTTLYEQANLTPVPSAASNSMIAIMFNAAFTPTTALTASLSYSRGYDSKPGVDASLFGPDDFANANAWTSTGGLIANQAKCASSNPIPSDAYYLINQNCNIKLTNAVSTVGYTTIRVSFTASVQTAGATLYLDWSPDGVTWNNGVWSTTSTTWQCGQTVTLPSGAAGQAGFRIRFRNTGSTTTQRAKVDYVKIIGTTSASGNWTNNAQVSLIDPSNTVTILKPFGATDVSSYDVKAYYTSPGTYQVRLEENLGGTATLYYGVMSVQHKVIQCDVSSCTSSAAPPPVQATGGGAARFTKNPDGNTLQVTYDASTCSAQKAILLYGTMGSWNAYAGCADSDLGNTGLDISVNVSGLTDVWFNIVWTQSGTAGHPGYGYNGTANVARSWLVGTNCGMSGDDMSHASCP